MDVEALLKESEAQALFISRLVACAAAQQGEQAGADERADSEHGTGGTP